MDQSVYDILDRETSSERKSRKRRISALIVKLDKWVKAGRDRTQIPKTHRPLFGCGRIYIQHGIYENEYQDAHGTPFPDPERGYDG